MKLLKIILLFAILVSGIFFATRWSGIISPIDILPPDDPIDVDVKCEEIRSAWSKEPNWNPQLLKSQKSDLDQDNSLGRYEYADDVETVLNTIRESATDKLCEAIFREFHSPTCDDKWVKHNFAGVDILSSTFDMEKDERLQKVRSVKALYDKITTFVNSKHRIIAKYDADENKWTSFSILGQSIINTAANYRKNTLYSRELSNINRFIDGLNDSAIRKVVNDQENGFYNSLSSQIIKHFQELSKDEENITEANLARFNNALDRYSRETKLRLTEMTTAYRDFKKKYEEKMKEE